MKKILLFSTFIVCMFIFPGPVHASFSMSILSIDPTYVSSNEQEVTLTATISGLPSPSFFRVEWQESSGHPYFGYSKNNSSNWIKVQNDQDCTAYYSVTDTNTSSLVLTTKIGSDNTPDNGSYLIKLRRYTESCASSSDSDPVAIQITLPTPSPTQTPNPTVVPTATPVKTAVPTQLPLKTTIPKPTPTSTPEVLGESDTQTEAVSSTEEASPEPTTTTSSGSKKGTIVIAIIFVALGITVMGLAGYMAYKKSKTTNL